MFFESLERIGRAGGCKTAGRWFVWRNAELIKFDEYDEGEYQNLLHNIKKFSP